MGSADFARETLAIVVRLRSSATDADVRPLAVPMGARVLLKVVANLLLVETFVKVLAKFHWKLHEILEAFEIVHFALTFATSSLILATFTTF